MMQLLQQLPAPRMVLPQSVGCILAGGGVPRPHEPPLARSGRLPWCWANSSRCLPACHPGIRAAMLSPAPPLWCCCPQL